MTTKEFQERSDLRIFLSYFKPHKKLFVLDMDGTFYLGNQILPGAADFYIFNLFKNLTKKLHFYPVQ